LRASASIAQGDRDQSSESASDAEKELNAEVEKLQGEVSRMQGQVRACLEENSALKQSLEQSKGELAESEQSASSERETVMDLRQELKDLQGEIVSLQSREEQASQLARDREEEASRLSAKLNSAVSAFASEKEAASKQLLDAMKENSELRASAKKKAKKVRSSWRGKCSTRLGTACISPAASTSSTVDEDALAKANKLAEEEKSEALDALRRELMASHAKKHRIVLEKVKERLSRQQAISRERQLELVQAVDCAHAAISAIATAVDVDVASVLAKQSPLDAVDSQLSSGSVVAPDSPRSLPPSPSKSKFPRPCPAMQLQSGAQDVIVNAISALQSQCAGAASQSKEVRSEITEVSAKSSALEAEVARLSEELADTKAKLDEASAATLDRTKELETATNEIASLRQTVDGMLTVHQFEEKKAELESQVATLKAARDEGRESEADLSSELASARAQLAEMQNRLSKHDEEMQSKMSTLVLAQDQSKKLWNTLADISGSAASGQELSKSDLVAAIRDQLGDVAKANSRVDELERSNAAL